MLWHCTSVTNVEHKKYGYCTKACVTVTNDVLFVVLYGKLYLASTCPRSWYLLGLDVDLTSLARQCIPLSVPASIYLQRGAASLALTAFAS
jgi:hypothetical protein